MYLWERALDAYGRLDSSTPQLEMPELDLKTIQVNYDNVNILPYKFETVVDLQMLMRTSMREKSIDDYMKMQVQHTIDQLCMSIKDEVDVEIIDGPRHQTIRASINIAK